MRALAPLAALLLSCCNVAGLVVLKAEPDLGVASVPELRTYCEAASGRWEHASGLTLSCTEGRPLRFGAPADPCAAASTSYTRVVVRDQAHALPCSMAGIVDTVPDTPEQLARGVAHELGHVLHGQRCGREHADDGLMSPQPGPGAAITEATLAWLCECAPCTKFEPEAL